MDAVEQSKLIKKECLKLLSRREHSRKEIEQKLNEKGFARHLIANALNEMISNNLQNDARFAQSYARQRFGKGFGPVRVTYELKQKGVDPEEIAGVTRSSENDWMAKMAQVCMKKFAHPNEMTREERAKCQRFLLQRGFSSEMIRDYFKQSTQLI